MVGKAGAPGEVEISIHDEIGFWGVSASQFLEQLKLVGKDAEKIHLSLHSPGGEVLDGLAIYNALKMHPAEVEVTVKGLAASMASVIMLAGDVVRIPKNAYVMIHRVGGGVFGDADDLRKYAEMMEQLEGGIVAAYAERTGLDEEELREMMAEETWMDGVAAVEKGIADEVVEAVKVEARAEWKGRFGEPPKGLFDRARVGKSKAKQAEESDMDEKQVKAYVDGMKGDLVTAVRTEMKGDLEQLKKDLVAELQKAPKGPENNGAGEGQPDVLKQLKEMLTTELKPLQASLEKMDGLIKSGVVTQVKGGGKAVEGAGGEGGADDLAAYDEAIKNAKSPLERGRALLAKKKHLEKQGE
jgi:ATP-dependent Clp endopeptidase proteolytic subunit ClpP